MRKSPRIPPSESEKLNNTFQKQKRNNDLGVKLVRRPKHDNQFRASEILVGAARNSYSTCGCVISTASPFSRYFEFLEYIITRESSGLQLALKYFDTSTSIRYFDINCCLPIGQSIKWKKRETKFKFRSRRALHQLAGFSVFHHGEKSVNQHLLSPYVFLSSPFCFFIFCSLKHTLEKS